MPQGSCAESCCAGVDSKPGDSSSAVARAQRPEPREAPAGESRPPAGHSRETRRDAQQLHGRADTSSGSVRHGPGCYDQSFFGSPRQNLRRQGEVRTFQDDGTRYNQRFQGAGSKRNTRPGGVHQHHQDGSRRRPGGVEPCSWVRFGKGRLSARAEGREKATIAVSETAVFYFAARKRQPTRHAGRTGCSGANTSEVYIEISCAPNLELSSSSCVFGGESDVSV